MAVSKWFDASVYLANKVAQLKTTEPSVDWTIDKVVDAFAANGFVGEAGAEAHFMQFGQFEDVAPNAFFNPTEYYRAKAAAVYNKQADPKTVTDTEAAFVKAAIKGLGMGAWTHYDTFGSNEKINPSNGFDTEKYMNAKLTALNDNLAAGQTAYKIEDVYAAFKAAGISALEHFMTFGGSGKGEVADPYKGTIPDAFKVDPAKQVNGGGSSEGQTYTLTREVDNFTGTDGNDTFLGGTNQIQAADVINGGAGVDTAKLYLDAGDAGLNATSVEKFQIQASAAARTFTATNVKGAEEFWSVDSSQKLTIANLQNNAVLGLENTNADLSASFKTSVIGAADTLKLATASSGAADNFVTVSVDDGGTASKFTTLEVNAVAGKSYITVDDGTDAANSTTDFTTIKTTGKGFVSLDDASSTGSAEPFANVTTVEMTAEGGSVVDLARSGNAKDVKVTGAAGDDTIIFAAGEFNTKDVIDLGAGKNTLTLGDADLAQAGTAELSKAINATKGVTVLATSASGDVAINAGRYANIDAFAVGLDSAVTGTNAGSDATNALAAVTVSGVAASGDSLEIQNNLTGGNAAAGSASSVNAGNAASGLVIRMAQDSGTDSFSLSIAENDVILTGGSGCAIGSGKTAGIAAVGLDAREIETLTINVSKDLTVNKGDANSGTAATADTLVGGNATLNITGSGDVDLGDLRASASDAAFQNLTVKAGELSGKLTLTTGNGNDIITVGSKGSVIAAGGGTDTITLGAGEDTVQFLAATDSGNVVNGSITNIDKIDKFQAGLGGDKLDWTGDSSAFFNLTAANRDEIKNSADLKAAADVAAKYITSNITWAAFEHDGKCYAIFEGTGSDGTYDGSKDLLIELVGAKATDFVATNFA